MFRTLLSGLNEGGAGVRAYEACARAARARIAEEPENAAALLLIAYAAQLFVESYDDQPLTVDAAAAETERFSEIVHILDEAHAKGSPATMLEAVNKVAIKVAVSNKS